MQKIFCVEDDENIRELITYAISSSGFEATGFENAHLFFKALSKEMPSLVLLDIMLPDEDGMEILKKLRQNPKTKKTPVIMLTAKSFEIDKVRGLDAGADDYITKPFSVVELISRINAVLRRSSAPDDKIAYKDIEMDILSRKVTVGGKEINLTYKEFELLLCLLKSQGIVLSRDKLMNDVWGFDFEGESRTIDVHIRTLRQKLGKSGNIIETVRNVGYKV
jgi:two-component system alkaline phosphatase synthesis response regulator PhoP